MQYDPLVAEADAEVLKAPVPASGLRQDVVELVAEARRRRDRSRPTAWLRAAGARWSSSSTHQCAIASLSSHDARRDRALLEVVLLAVDALQLSGLVVAVLLADEHLDLLRGVAGSGR